MTTIKGADILIPRDCDHQRWSVVACDQFTSQRDYWQKLSDYVGESPSTLKLIFPEVYLEDGDGDDRIDTINKTMSEYLASGVFDTLEDSAVLIRRDTASGARLGLVCAVDLEDYCFTHPSHALIRSTEGVVLDRIPPRLKIRENAPIELPHIMLLIDDRNKSVIEKLYEGKDNLEKLYDFDLNMGGGHLEGYKVDGRLLTAIFDEYEKSVQTLYGNSTNDFIFAVGDGNHSLATAQAHWNNVKSTLSEQGKANHPARFALCEIENLHDDGIKFEPIHRFVFGADEGLVEHLKNTLSGDKQVRVFAKDKAWTISVDANSAKAIKDIQDAIDTYIKGSDMVVDYIHGIEHLESISSQHDGVAIVMPKIEKGDLFSYVLNNGTLCRKAFSMGEAEEKRYYFEAKRIR